MAIKNKFLQREIQFLRLIKIFIFYILKKNVFSEIKKLEAIMSLVHKSFDILPREIWLQIISKLRLVFLIKFSFFIGRFHVISSAEGAI